jgi:hypothetical protein
MGSTDTAPVLEPSVMVKRRYGLLLIWRPSVDENHDDRKMPTLRSLLKRQALLCSNSSSAL